MKYKISKEKVIEAIVKEPLASGKFFDLEAGYGIDDGKCEVCAVGAILRNTKKREFSSIDAENACHEIYTSDCLETAYETENFLSILSSEFETASMDHVPELSLDELSLEELKHFSRFHALMVAEGMCPDVLEFEV